MPEPEWYETFFSRMAVDFWSAAVPPDATRADAELLIRELRLEPGHRVLDLPCGAGRHVRALRERGFDVTGIDISPAAVAQLPGALVGDMRDPVPGGPYDAAYCFGNSFGYLVRSDTERFMRNVRAALKPGARWAIDTHLAAELALPHTPMERSLEAGGIGFFVRTRWEETTREIVQAATLTQGTERQDSEIRYRIFTTAEIESMLTGAGFRVVDRQGPARGRLLLIAEAA